mmetsp:Transcript_44862/g.116202  ORF Transcript_44862/g.116202 Transcript_44862/m.116202 type:complete len:338 (-) Transcript_44862:443-1456(-)
MAARMAAETLSFEPPLTQRLAAALPGSVGTPAVVRAAVQVGRAAAREGDAKECTATMAKACGAFWRVALEAVSGTRGPSEELHAAAERPLDDAVLCEAALPGSMHAVANLTHAVADQAAKDINSRRVKFNVLVKAIMAFRRVAFGRRQHEDPDYFWSTFWLHAAMPGSFAAVAELGDMLMAQARFGKASLAAGAAEEWEPSPSAAPRDEAELATLQLPPRSFSGRAVAKEVPALSPVPEKGEEEPFEVTPHRGDEDGSESTCSEVQSTDDDADSSPEHRSSAGAPELGRSARLPMLLGAAAPHRSPEGLPSHPLPGSKLRASGLPRPHSAAGRTGGR